MRHPEGGNASLAVIGGVAFVAVLSLAVTDLGLFLLARSRAQTAADAAALAAAAEMMPGAKGIPAAEAERLAGLNDARLVECLCSRGLESATVEVEVRVRFLLLEGLGRETVSARARADVDLRRLGELSD